MARTIAFAALFPLALAFQDTVPVVAWTSHPSGKLDSLAAHAAPFRDSPHFFDALAEGDDLCQYDAVFLAEHPGLHASDLRILSPSSYIPSQLSTAPSSLQVPYLPDVNGTTLDKFKRSIVERCGARHVELDLGQGGVNLLKGEMHIVCVSMPHLAGGSNDRKAAMREHETLLSNDIARIMSDLPSHIVIYTGSGPFSKRQAISTQADPDSPTRPVLQSGPQQEAAFAPINTTLAEGGLLKRYRFFTPGLITALLVTFGLLLPVVMIGIYALASIQSPLRMDSPKGPSLEKKTQ